MAQCYGPRRLATRACPLVVLFAILYCPPAFSASWTVEGRVVGGSDSDTVTILDRDKRQHKIRFNWIDAPEKNQPFGNRSRQNLASLVSDRNVRAECGKRDRYGREICKILDGSRDAGLEQIRAGMAWWNRAYENEQSHEDRERLRDRGAGN
jgi:endonuclease YncB( thermonuclease family)